MLKKDKQALFDYVKGALLDQGGPGWHNGACQFRGEKGRDCAIGVILPDWAVESIRKDRVDLEALNPWSLLEEVPVLGLLWGISKEEDMYFLNSIQSAHDNAAIGSEMGCSGKLDLRFWPELLKEEFKQLAEYYNLRA